MIKVTLTILGHETHIDEYRLSKTVDDFGVVTSIDSEAKFENPASDELLRLTAEGYTEEPAELELICGADTITYDAFIGHNEGKYNIKHCYALKPIRFKPVYDCIKNPTVNIFDYTPSPISTIQGDLQRDSYGNARDIYFGNEDNPYTLEQVLSILGGIPDRTAAGWVIEYISVTAVPTYIEQQGSDGEYEVYVGHDCQLFVSYVRSFQIPK